jgi:Putative peptidoglycan binding domain
MVFSTAAPAERVQVGTTPGGCRIMLNRRSVCMLKQAQQDGGFTIRLVQGSFNPCPNPCCVEDSKGTHDGGGVFDASVKDLTETQIKHRVRHLRLAGWAAWHRTTIGGPHIHAVAIGDTQLPQKAKNQVTSYKNGGNGLANDGPDPDARVAEKFFSDAFLARYVTSAPPIFADASILAFVSLRFQRTLEQFTSPRSEKSIKLVQGALKELGLYPFPVDGKWGRETHKGFRLWQGRLGIEHATGVVKRASLEALGRRSANFRVKD